MKTRKVYNRSFVLKLIALGSAVALNGGIPLGIADDWSEVNEDVRDRIAMLQPSIGTYNIEIDNRGRGDIALEGYVESEEARQRVQRAAEQASGVKQVENHLKVSQGESGRPESEVAELQNAFRREVPHGRYAIAVNTFPSRVVLHGTVDSPATKSKILEVASSVSKRTIVDELTVAPGMTDANIRESIQRALNQEYPNLMKGLEVTVKDGVARVEGNVSSSRDLDRVLASILNIQGVQDVQSEVKVRGRAYPHGRNSQSSMQEEER
jgi:osmotically-inducible protein OsmY